MCCNIVSKGRIKATGHCRLVQLDHRSTLDCKRNVKLERGPMPNVMAALSNIGGALCSMPQSLADAHYWSDVQ